jgi:DNA (cytosine-5)-methyltransferase 1
VKRLLDLFSGAGGAGMGYSRAGFDVTGVDIKPMPNYPFTFVQADALDYLREHGHKFDVVHASPPCQDYSAMRRATRTRHERLIDDVRTELLKLGKPYAIENVEGADLKNPLLLCGTMFGLRVRRHRLFETDPPIWFPPTACECRNGVVSGRLIGQRVAGRVAPGRTKPPHHTEDDRREAIGVPWMTTMEARQAIPPEYTRFIGEQLLEALSYAEAAS